MTPEEQIDFVQQVLNMNTLTYRTITPTVDAMNNILASLKELQQFQSNQAALIEALSRIIELLDVWLGEHTHNVKINPGDEHSDELSACDECGTVLDDHGYDTGCETGWIMEAVDIAQQAIKAAKE